MRGRTAVLLLDDPPVDTGNRAQRAAMADALTTERSPGRRHRRPRGRAAGRGGRLPRTRRPGRGRPRDRGDPHRQHGRRHRHDPRRRRCAAGEGGIPAGVAEGFVGNPAYADYRAQAEFLVEDGASPTEVDAACRELGMAVGPFAEEFASCPVTFAQLEPAARGQVPPSVATLLDQVAPPLEGARA